jgi:hypothetical protein
MPAPSMTMTHLFRLLADQSPTAILHARWSNVRLCITLRSSESGIGCPASVTTSRWSQCPSHPRNSALARWHAGALPTACRDPLACLRSPVRGRRCHFRLIASLELLGGHSPAPTSVARAMAAGWGVTAGLGPRLQCSIVGGGNGRLPGVPALR